MTLVDFVMTFPCFVPLQPSGVPFTFNAEGDDCLPVFTDDDLLRRFCESSSVGTVVGRAKIANSAALVNVLRDCDHCEIGQGRIVTHVILDPSAEMARVHSISEFVAHLERTD